MKMDSFIFLSGIRNVSTIETDGLLDMNDTKMIEIPMKYLEKGKGQKNILIEVSRSVSDYNLRSLSPLFKTASFLINPSFPVNKLKSLQEKIMERSEVVNKINKNNNKLLELRQNISSLLNEKRFKKAQKAHKEEIVEIDQNLEKARNSVKKVENKINSLRTKMKEQLGMSNIRSQIVIPVPFMFLNYFIDKDVSIRAFQVHNSVKILVTPCTNSNNNSSIQDIIINLSLETKSDLISLLKNLPKEKPKLTLNTGPASLFDISEHDLSKFNLAKELDNFIDTNYKIPSLSSIDLKDLQPVAKMKTNIMASLVASGLIDLNDKFLIENEEHLAHQIMKKETDVIKRYSEKNKELVNVEIIEWKPKFGLYNVLRKEFTLIEE